MNNTVVELDLHLPNRLVFDIFSSFSQAGKHIKAQESPINEVSEASNLSFISDCLSDIKTAVNKIADKITSTDWLSLGSFLTSMISLGADIFDIVGSLKLSGNASSAINNISKTTSGNRMASPNLASSFSTLGMSAIYIIDPRPSDIIRKRITNTPTPSSSSPSEYSSFSEYHNSWLIEELLEKMSNIYKEITSSTASIIATLGVALGIIGTPVGAIIVAITGLITIIGFLNENWDTISSKIEEVLSAVQILFSEFITYFQNIFAKDFTEQFGVLGISLNVFFDRVEGVWNAIKKVFGGIVDFVKNVFAGNWSAAWDSIVQIFTGIWEGIVGYFKPPLNAIIGFINGLISAIVNAVNFVIRAVNKLSIDIPNWDIFGSLAGKTFGLSIPLVSGCEIPYLAKGAVLPANRPFMAIVGDQRHGTNVEAPLATIQEAVAVVMEDQTAAIVAGFNASIGIQRELLSAVLGIRIGDEVIGRAADRYFAKRAAMGGY